MTPAPPHRTLRLAALARLAGAGLVTLLLSVIAVAAVTVATAAPGITAGPVLVVIALAAAGAGAARLLGVPAYTVFAGTALTVGALVALACLADGGGPGSLALGALAGTFAAVWPAVGAGLAGAARLRARRRAARPRLPAARVRRR